MTLHDSPPHAHSTQEMRLAILCPLYNDWASARNLLAEIDRSLALQHPPLRIFVLLVDDGSTIPCPDDFADAIPGQSVVSVRLLRLARNVGHQRAICIGLAYAEEHVSCDAVVVMDCDGEDRPPDILRLLQALEANAFGRIVFAARARRSEGPIFRLGYGSYRLLHRMLTGIPVRFGNFSIIPASVLPSLPLVPEAWNHYAAGVVKARLPFTSIPIARGTRYAGESSMNVISLTMHGVGAFSVFAELISVRLLIAAMTVVFLATATTLGLVWAQSKGAGMVALAVLASFTIFSGCLGCLILGVFMLGVHALRGTSTFLPKRDYRYFIRSQETLFGQPDDARLDSGARRL